MTLRGLRAAILASLLSLIGADIARGQPSVLFYQNSQDQARSFDVDTLVAGPMVTGFLGGNVGNSRNIQADGDDDVLWYADAQGNIRSKTISTNIDRPAIVTNAVLAGVIMGADRHFSIDPWANKMYYSVSDGTVQVIDLGGMTTDEFIPLATFLNDNPGSFRHTTIDSVNRLLYYARSDNSIRSFRLDNFSAGPTVPSNLIFGGIAGALRHLIYDPNSGLIWYSVEDGSVHSVDPVAQTAGPTLSSTTFTDNVGAGRIITMTYQVLPEPDVTLLRGVALAALLVLSRGWRRKRSSIRTILLDEHNVE